MKSQTLLIAGNYRLQEWVEKTRSCQNRDLNTSVKEWCGQHNLTVADYYYRLKEVRKACLQNIPEREITQSIVPVSEKLITSGTGTAIKISVGDFQISVSDTTTPELLKMVLQVAADVK